MDVSMQEEDLCQAFSDVLLNNVEDIDAEDCGNPQLCSDYVKDIYLYLRQLEVWHTESVLLQRGVYLVAHAALSPTAAAVGAPTLPWWEDDQWAYACNFSWLACPGPLKIPASAGNTVHVCCDYGPFLTSKSTMFVNMFGLHDLFTDWRLVRLVSVTNKHQPQATGRWTACSSIPCANIVDGGLQAW